MSVQACLRQVRMAIERRKGERNGIQEQKERIRAEGDALAVQATRLEQARVIIQMVATETQKELEFHISELGTAALSTVFHQDPYSVQLAFVPKRGRTEAEITFARHGSSVEPISCSGGGAVDVAAFALRVSLWSLARPRTNNTLILDEPFRNLSRDLAEQASALLKEISSNLGLQLIVVSHDPALIAKADRVFVVERKGAVSKVTQQ